MLRLIAFVLAIFFMFKVSFDLRANARRIEAEFSFAPLPLTAFRWRDLGIGFEHWQMKRLRELRAFPLKRRGTLTFVGTNSGRGSSESAFSLLCIAFSL
jgi:hypothetical protein